MSRFLRKLLRGVLFGVAALALLAIAAYFVLRSSFFASYVRKQVLARIENETGAKASLGSIQIEPSSLQVTLRDLTIHGTEPTTDPPLFYSPQIRVRLALLSSGHAIQVTYVGITRPAVNLDIFANHKSNIPTPSGPRTFSLQSTASTAASLAIGEFVLTDGAVRFADRTIPLTIHARNVLATARFDRTVSQYRGTVSGNLLTDAHANIDARFAVPFQVGSQVISVSGARISTNNSSITLSAKVSRLSQPTVEVTADTRLATLDLQSIFGLRVHPGGAPQSVEANLALNLSSSGIEVQQGSFEIGASHLEAAGSAGQPLSFRGSIALAQLGALFGDKNLPQGNFHVSGQAELSFSSYRIQGTLAAPFLAFRESDLPTVRIDSSFQITPQAISLPHVALYADRAALVGALTLNDNKRIVGRLRLRDMPMAEIARFFTASRLGYSGNLSANLDVGGLVSEPDVDAHLTILPARGGIPVAGRMNCRYTAASGIVTVSDSFLDLPHTRIEVSGQPGRVASLRLISQNVYDLAPALNLVTHSQAVSLRGGTARVTVTETGPLRNPFLNSSVDLEAFGVDGRRFESLRALVDASSQKLAISSGSLTRAGSETQFSGQLDLADWRARPDSSVAARLVIRRGQIADFLALAGESHLPMRGRIQANVDIRGHLSDPIGSVSTQIADASVYGQALQSASLLAELDDRQITLRRMTATLPAGEIQAEGTFTHPAQNLTSGLIRAHIQAAGVEFSHLAIIQDYRPGASGTMNADATFAGSLAGLHHSFNLSPSLVDGHLSLTDVRDRSMTYGDLILTTRTEGNDAIVAFTSTLAGFETKVNGSISLTPTHSFSADYTIRSLNLRTLEPLLSAPWQSLAGVVTAKGHLYGTPKDPQGHIRAELTKADIRGEYVNKAQIEASYSATKLRIDSFQISTPAGSAELTGSFVHPASHFDEGQFVLQANAANLDVSQIGYLRARHASGSLALKANLAGDLHGYRQVNFDRADLAASLNNAQWNGTVLGGASLVTRSEAHAIAVTFDSHLLSSTAQANGRINLGGYYSSSLNLAVSHLDLAPIDAIVFPSMPKVHTQIDASAQFAGPLLDPKQATAKLQFTKFEASLAPEVTFANQGPIVLGLARGVVSIESAHLTGPSSDISVAGVLAAQSGGTMKVTAKANADLAGLKRILPGSAASGIVDLNTTIQGTIANPQLAGRIRLSNASLQLASWPNGFYNANGDILLSGNGARIQSVTGQSGGGKVTLTGFASLRNSILTYNLHADAHQVRTRYADASVTAKAALTLSGTNRAGLLNGTVTISRVGYGQQSDIGSILAAATNAPAPPSAATGAFSAIRSRVRIVTASDVLFQTTLAQQLSATADLTLIGSLQSPGMTGRINITGGTLVFFSNKYSVDRGNISFYDATRIHPVLDIDLETIAQGVDVNLTVAGPIDDLKLTYRSDPPLRFEDIIALLAAGRTPPDPTIAANQPLAPDQGAMQMGESALLGAAVANPLSSRLQRVFGISQLTIAPTFVSGTALPQARITLQQQVTQNVTFTYSQDVSQTNAELVRIEWELTSRFSAVATRDENGVFSVDFFWKKNFH